MLQVRQRGEAIHPRHQQIEQHQVETVLLKERQRLRAGFGSDDLVVDAERDGEQLQDLRRVVDRQQASSFVIEIQVLQRHAALVEMN